MNASLCTGVKLRLFCVYIESVTMSSQEPPKKDEITGYFVCTANAHGWMSCILCQYALAGAIWKNTRLIMAMNHKQECFCKSASAIVKYASDVIYWGEFLKQVDKNFSLLLRSCLRCRKQIGNTFIVGKTMH